MPMLVRLVTLLQNSFVTVPNMDRGLGPIGDDFKTGFEDCHKTHKHRHFLTGSAFTTMVSASEVTSTARHSVIHFK